MVAGPVPKEDWNREKRGRCQLNVLEPPGLISLFTTMKTVTLLLSVLSLISLRAQEAAPPKAEPARTNALSRREAAPLVSPEIHPDRSVTFRLRAPKANEVKVAGEWPGGSTAFTNDNGVWSATVGALEPDIYGYSL